MMRGQGGKKITRRALVAGGAATLGVASMAYAVPARSAERFCENVMVQHVGIGGQEYGAAQDLLQNALGDFNQSPVEIHHEGQTWTPSLADLGYTLDLDATLTPAWDEAREESVRDWYAMRLGRHVDERVYPLVFTRDETIRDAYLDDLASEVEIAPVEAILTWDGTSMDVEPDEDGATLDREQLLTELESALASGEQKTVDLVLQAQSAETTAEQLDEVRTQAETLYSDPVTLVSGEYSWTIEPETLAAALIVPSNASVARPFLDPARLGGGFEDISAELTQTPVNATVGWNGGFYAIELGSYGQEVDADALASEIARAASEDDRTAEVPVTPVEPPVRSDNLHELGWTGLTATSASSLAGSSPERAENVRVSANHLTSTLIPPGGQFSFNHEIGPITTDNGYVEGRMITGDWYTDAIGGGVCQTSTAVFRTLLRAGLRFDEWHPHSMRVDFYELGGWPMGIDAAIYQYDLDLRFTNPTDSWMLLQTFVDGDDAVAQLIGPDLGWEVEIEEPQISDPIPPPEPRTRSSSELASGQSQRAQEAAPGYDISFRRIVRAAGAEPREEWFNTHFQPQPQITEVG